VKLQQRRSQTEARISIFKNGFLGSPLLSKGHENQSREVAWSVLAHNLWVIARLPQDHARALANEAERRLPPNNGLVAETAISMGHREHAERTIAKTNP
jgi:hypothetical protein